MPFRNLVPPLLLGLLLLVPGLVARAAPSDRVQLTLDTSEADQVLAILALRQAGKSVDDARWQSLFVTAPYRRLKERERKIAEQFRHDTSSVLSDEDFKKFVLSDDLLARAPQLRETLERWKHADLRRSAERVLDYLPAQAFLHAKIYPIIKPGTNSFVWELAKDPTIFLYLDPEVTRAKFENTVAHELHHIGLGSLGPVYSQKIADLPERARAAAEWMGCFGEGLAMLAAAGGPYNPGSIVFCGTCFDRNLRIRTRSKPAAHPSSAAIKDRGTPSATGWPCWLRSDTAAPRSFARCWTIAACSRSTTRSPRSGTLPAGPGCRSGPKTFSHRWAPRPVEPPGRPGGSPVQSEFGGGLTVSRVATLSIMISCLVTTAPAQAAPPDFRLQVVPAVVYKVDDPGGAGTSSFVFNLVVIHPVNDSLTAISARVELSSGGSTVERQDWTAAMLAKIEHTNYRILPSTPLGSPVRLFTLPEAFDLRFYFRVPQALAVDSANIRLTVADASGGRAEQMLRIPIRYYQQKTALIVPFHGRGVVGQDWITSGGHGGFFADFALDLRGLDQNYAEQTSDSDDNASAAGWGREILAPAAGTVVYARNDVPNNRRQGERPDTSAYTALHDPSQAYAGNCVIIDHGSSEFSVLMHLQQGSVIVKVGERVTSGQVVGRLGNSGDSFGPHLHYQLQSGPHLFHDQSLPFRFQNSDPPQLSRGRFFETK
jgi:hypothetical protein